MCQYCKGGGEVFNTSQLLGANLGLRGTRHEGSSNPKERRTAGWPIRKMRHLFKLAAGAFALTPVSGFGLAPRAPCLSSVDRIVPASTQPRGSRGQSRATAAVCPDINMIATASGGTPRGQPPRGRGAAAKKVRREVIFCGALQCFCHASVSHCCRCCAYKYCGRVFSPMYKTNTCCCSFFPSRELRRLQRGGGRREPGARCRAIPTLGRHDFVFA